MANKIVNKILITTTLAWSLGAVAAPGPNGVKLAQLDVNSPQCKKELAQYVETLRYLRTTAGEQITNRVANGYVTEAQLERVAAIEGTCAATQLLRDKKAVR
jgi:hypothetical protein